MSTVRCSKSIPTVSYQMENFVLPTAAIDSPAQPTSIHDKRNNNKFLKRQQQQQPSDNVVHVTITASGTVIYTHTATSYSYIPTYSTIDGSNNSSSSSSNDGSNGSNSNNSSSSGVNTNAIIGGVVGGVTFIALIGLAFLLMRRSQKRKRNLQQQDGYIDDNDSYYQGRGGNGAAGAISGAGMTSSVPAPRHLVAPFAGLGGEREGDGRESKYYQHEGGYYEDIVVPNNMYPKSAYYSTTNSVTSDSLPSTTVENSQNNNGYASPGYTAFRQIPNEVDYPIPAATEERHIPHLKENMQEPPHSKD